MLNALGLDSDQVHAATAHEVMYQCVMRTSLRDPGSREVVHAILPDELSGRRLAKIVGVDDKGMTQLGSLFQMKSKPLTQRQKDQRHEARSTLEAFYAPESLPGSFINDNRL